jgi:mannose-1-phosphate guanylyltransferase
MDFIMRSDINSMNKLLDHFYAVIMAGGGGTRLWPLSRKARPKQMLRLLEERTLFQTSVERLNGVFFSRSCFSS